jgi:hypothetical protein
MFGVLPEMEAESDRRTASDGAAFLGVPHGRDSPPMIEITLHTNMMAQFAEPVGGYDRCTWNDRILGSRSEMHWVPRGPR